MSESSGQPAGDTVICTVDGAVGRLTMNRPQSLNALDPALARDLRVAAQQLAEDSRVRCIVLCGAGDHFMAGGDIRSFQAALPALQSGDRSALEAMFEDVHGIIRSLRGNGKPVVAEVRGACAGFGLSLMAACDLAWAADDCTFTLAYCHLGVSPDGGSTWSLPRTVGFKRSMELALLGDRFDAAQAREWGLVNRVLPAAELAAGSAAIAARLAAGPAAAYARSKALVNASFERDLDAQLDAERDAFIDCACGGEFAEGVDAFLLKRRPDFRRKS